MSQLLGVKGDLRRDEDLAKYMSNCVKERDVMIEQLKAEQHQAIVSSPCFLTVLGKRKRTQADASQL